MNTKIGLVFYKTEFSKQKTRIRIIFFDNMEFYSHLFMVTELFLDPFFDLKFEHSLRCLKPDGFGPEFSQTLCRSIL